jgi:hypothetical protein
LILDGGSGRNSRQGIASVIAGPETVVADGLVAWAAFDHRIPASLDRAAVGTGLESGPGGFPVVAGTMQELRTAAQLMANPSSGFQATAVAKTMRQAAARRRLRMIPRFGALGRPILR